MCGKIDFWRQGFILFTGLLFSFSVGFMLSFPAVLTPAITSPNATDIQATSAEASWITASNGIAGLCGFFILSPILQTSGRKLAHMSVNALLLIGWIIFSLANGITALFAARIIQGTSIGGIYINSIIIGEYVHPSRRGYFMTLKKTTMAIGTLCCHALSVVWNWRQIAAFSIIAPSVAILMTMFWPESPFYLAMKGRFEECENSFKWLNGKSNTDELHQLLSSQKNMIKNKTKEKWYKFLLRKEFLQPLLIVSLLTLLLDSCGRYFFVVYVIQIMVELIGDRSVAVYCSLGADVLTIIALMSSCFVVRRFQRRHILFSFGIATVTLMLLVSLVLLLKSFNIGTNVIWLTPCIIILQSFTVNMGLIPVSFAIIGEIFPLEYKGSGSCISGVIFTLLYTVTLKITPVLMENTGIGGTYAVYGVSIAVCLGLLYFVLPETKDKTLQQIEDEIKGVERSKCNAETNALL